MYFLIVLYQSNNFGLREVFRAFVLENTHALSVRVLLTHSGDDMENGGSAIHEIVNDKVILDVSGRLDPLARVSIVLVFAYYGQFTIGGKSEHGAEHGTARTTYYDAVARFKTFEIVDTALDKRGTLFESGTHIIRVGHVRSENTFLALVKKKRQHFCWRLDY